MISRRNELVCAGALSGTWMLSIAAAGSLALAVEAGTTAALSGRTAAPLTLQHAVQIALEANPELRAARLQVDAAAGRAAQAGLWANPDLEFSAEDWRVRGSSSGFSSSKQMVGVAQTVPFPGKKGLEKSIGAAEAGLAEAQSVGRRLALVRDVKASFFQVLAAEQLVEVQRELVNVAAKSAEAARQRVEAGAAPDQEQLRAEIPLEQARSELAELKRDLAFARHSLGAALGRPDLQDSPLEGRLSADADFPALERPPADWMKNHPQTVAARKQRARAEHEWQRARLEPYPDVTLGLAGGREGGSDSGSLVEFRVSIPVPIIDRSKGRKQEARATAAMAAADLEAVEQSLLRAWNDASQQFRTAAQQVANYRDRILPKADEALRLVQTGFQEGKFSFIDLLDTQRTAAEARLAFQRKLLDLNVARVELEALLGGAQEPHQRQALEP
ncbi:MAG: TolC family protein [Verrucomicrobiia bacterium]